MAERMRLKIIVIVSKSIPGASGEEREFLAMSGKFIAQYCKLPSGETLRGSMATTVECLEESGIIYIRPLSPCGNLRST